ncbi:iml2p [Saccharomyces arboricola H-6]|uniref:Iml2p n=1 Tax=Saccharomyces arboricola (strain H-6 / AS 2.3317 / CBS 10644) TaxID=1160507 RepID=J8Q6E0_SACAR|nr:iml2p [Saccharomyces arboricola H-6]
MFRVFGSFGSRNARPSSEEQPTKTKLILRQASDFEIALKGMDFVLDDRTDEGLALLQNAEMEAGSDQTILTLARGVIEFLQATLSFETEEMKKAAITLGKAEQMSWKSKQNAEKTNFKSSSIYPPGTVYAVTYTESCLLHALLMLFSESMMEAAKALLKLRRAYTMLQDIMITVKKAERSKNSSSPSPSENSQQSCGSFVSAETTFTSVDIPYRLSSDDESNPQLLQFAEKIYTMRIGRLSGAHIGSTPSFHRLRDDLGLKSTPSQASDNHSVPDDFDLEQPTIDEFIHSGANLCYGILQVVLSLLPPAIGAVLSIVGFKGSREEGLRLVWKATRERNVHGCIGLLGLMFYYDGPFQFTDADFDIPANDESKALNKSRTNDSSTLPGYMDSATLLHPGRILEDALLKARALFPNSALWLLNEAKMLSGKGRLRESLALMDSIDVNSIRMRQVKSLMVFERAILLVNLHEYNRAAGDLISLLDISDWSHALYTYFAGCCYLENWRMTKLGLLNDGKEQFYKEKARELIFDAPSLLGKKTFKSKNLPLDRFMLRKVQQFNDMQKKLNLEEPLDSIATSPVHELSYFYNGYNRMTGDDLVLTKRMLTEYHNPAIDSEDPDQELIRNLLLSLTLRRLGDAEEGLALLDDIVLPKIFYIQHGKVKYFKKNEDPWAYPAALYERALFCWKLGGMESLKESREWLLRAQNYAADYELSTRIGMKIKAALDRVENALA